MTIRIPPPVLKTGQRARRCIYGGRKVFEIVNVQEALEFYGIRRDEFYQFEKETDDE